MPMAFSEVFTRFLFHLHDKKVKYLLVGGYAVVHYGYPRYTGDMDIWLEPTIVNGEKVLLALKACGYEVTDLKAADFSTQNYFRVGFPPDRIDLITETPALIFKKAYPKKQTIKHKGVPITVIELEDLITTKEALGRLQDKLDVEKLRSIIPPNEDPES